MTTAATEYDADLLAVARQIYDQRTDQKFGGNRRWQQLKSEHPELARAAQPAPKGQAEMSDAELNIWREAREDAERTHSLVEDWAHSQTACRSKYFYRGRRSVIADSKSSSPKWCEPYGSWHYTDRGRWARADGGDLRTFHVETDGGFNVEGDGSRENLLEVCRLCGKPLELPRDQDGNVERDKGGRTDYCSRRCVLDVYNARRRAKTKARKPLPKTFDLTAVYVSGIGRVDVSVAEWVGREKLSPRSDPPITLPFMHRNPRSLSIPADDIRELFRDDTATGWFVGGGPDAIARKWGNRQSYWPATGVTPPGYVSSVRTSAGLPGGWDGVTRAWRYVEPCPVSGMRIKQPEDKVWCASR